jgi:PD-(D/E)XK nuclease superfamily
MPITLITGPANAGKAREVMDAVRRHVAHGEEPLLVVPTRADVDQYRRELVEAGVVAGARVERFEGLIGEAVARAGGSGPVLSGVARERVLASLLAHGGDERGGGSYRGADGDERHGDDVAAGRGTPGLVRALAGVVAELEVQRVTPARLVAAAREWAVADGARAAEGAEELGRLFGEYQRALKQIGHTDRERRAAQALDALRREPALWGGTPVLMYGFDDFDGLQLDAIETLGVVVGAPVTVSLAYEPGRTAFAGRAGTFETLAPLAAEHRRLQGRAEYYAPRARTALHHLERSLFEPGATKVDAAGAVRLLEGGGERAELELVAGEIRTLLDQGIKPEEIAVVHRTPSVVADLLGEVFGTLGIPHALERRVSFADTATGGALVGALRCATDDGELGDLLAWLRAPGLLERPELADRLEARARREGASSAARAKAIWEAEHWRLEALDHLRDAAERDGAARAEAAQGAARGGAGRGGEARRGEARRGGAALSERAGRELEWLFNAPRRGHAALLESDELDEARALAVGRRALAELGRLARAAPELGADAAELARVLASLEIVSGERAGPGRVAVVDPLALRARRVRALFLIGLQEGVFPASARPEPLLAEEERRRLVETSGLRLGGSRLQDALAAERYALYAAVSRPEELLILSWHAGSDDGVAEARSLFVDDVLDLFEAGLEEGRARRPLGAVNRAGSRRTITVGDRADESLREGQMSGGSVATVTSDDPTPSNDGARAPASLGPLSDEELLQELRDHVWSPSSLEVWAGCPVKWFVQRMLRAEDLDPQPEPLARGGLAHAALKDTLEGLRERTGSARLTQVRLGLAQELLREALSRREAEFPLSAAPERRPGLRRRLEADLERYLQHAAERESPLEPTYLELGFGFGEELREGVDPSGRGDLPEGVGPSEGADLPEGVGPSEGADLPEGVGPSDWAGLPEGASLPALDLGAGLRLRGRIDRVDLAAGGGQAVVYDYKGRNAPPAAKWTEQGNVQVALYMRAVEELLGLEVVGGFYQPLSGADLRARGVLDGESGVQLECVRGEVREHAEVRQLLEEAVATARQAAMQAGRGELEPRPRTCAFRGGCMYPTICRCEQ